MEQIYLLEIFVDKVNIFSKDTETANGSELLIIKIKFGPKTQFIIKESQLAENKTKKEDMTEVDDKGQKKWSRTIRVGKSYLFSSFPDTVLNTLDNFPLEIEVWNDDREEKEIFVGVGQMFWNSEFYHMLKENSNPCQIHEPLSIKEVTPLRAECCCKLVGEIEFILRLTALGKSITTEFQQLMDDPDSFVFRTDRAPSTFQCRRVEGDDPNFVMVGSVYETTTLEDPEVVKQGQQVVEICTELQSCAMGKGLGAICTQEDKNAKPTIEKIRMGDITGPCGNANCPLAHKVRAYIRNLEAYKLEAGKITTTKDNRTGKICGSCVCKDDKWHREDCPNYSKDYTHENVDCTGCGGRAPEGKTCTEQDKKLFGTGATPKGSTTNVGFVFTDPNKNAFNKSYTVENVTINYDSEIYNKCHTSLGCSKSGFQKPTPKSYEPQIAQPKNTKNNNLDPGLKNFVVYNVEAKESKDPRKLSLFYQDATEYKDCKCSPPKPKPSCRTFNCECPTENANIASRKAHKPYCPSYKHKVDCPVNMVKEDEVTKKDEDEDETEPLPYGLPPIQLGPCPVLGRPCSVPDGFARMYKTAALPPQPPSWSDAGKVCCSKEFERIKKAIQEYMKYEKDHDMRCVNKFIVDTEKRCCDTDQRLFSLVGKGCCGAHKLALNNEYKKADKKKE